MTRVAASAVGRRRKGSREGTRERWSVGVPRALWGFGGSEHGAGDRKDCHERPQHGLCARPERVSSTGSGISGVPSVGIARNEPSTIVAMRRSRAWDGLSAPQRCHELSIPSGSGACLGWQPAAKVSMIRI